MSTNGRPGAAAGAGAGFPAWVEDELGALESGPPVGIGVDEGESGIGASPLEGVKRDQRGKLRGVVGGLSDGDRLAGNGERASQPVPALDNPRRHPRK